MCSTTKPQATPSTSGKFKGEGDNAMIERLIQSCQEHQHKPALPGYGRELVKAMDTGFFDLPAPGDAAAARTPVNNNQAKAGSNSNGKRKGSPPNLARPAAQDRPNTTTTKPGNNNKAANAAKAPKTPAGTSPGKNTPKAAPPSFAIKPANSPLSNNSFACPAFFSSPKPTDLPIPSASLLLRAHGMVAVAAGM